MIINLEQHLPFIESVYMRKEGSAGGGQNSWSTNIFSTGKALHKVCKRHCLQLPWHIQPLIECIFCRKERVGLLTYYFLCFQLPLASISDHRSKTTLYNDWKALNVLSTELLLQLQSRQTQTKAFRASVHCWASISGNKWNLLDQHWIQKILRKMASSWSNSTQLLLM